MYSDVYVCTETGFDDMFYKLFQDSWNYNRMYSTWAAYSLFKHGTARPTFDIGQWKCKKHNTLPSDHSTLLLYVHVHLIYIYDKLNPCFMMLRRKNWTSKNLSFPENSQTPSHREVHVQRKPTCFKFNCERSYCLHPWT